MLNNRNLSTELIPQEYFSVGKMIPSIPSLSLKKHTHTEINQKWSYSALTEQSNTWKKAQETLTRVQLRGSIQRLAEKIDETMQAEENQFTFWFLVKDEQNDPNKIKYGPSIYLNQIQSEICSLESGQKAI